jgi:lysozyme family protein
VSAPSDFAACDKLVLVYDGFKDDRAPGETFATAYGVTEYTWRWAIEQGIVPNIPLDQATAEHCIAVRHAFWNMMRCSSYPPGVGLMVYNDGVLCGMGHATRLLQRVVGVDADGIIGKLTIGAVAAMDPGKLVDLLAQADDEYFESLANAPLYLKGWERREEFMRQKAHAMIEAQ